MTSYINIGGKARPFRFSYKASKKLVAMGAGLPNGTADVGTSEIIMLGFEFGAKADKIDLDFTIEQLEDWLDEDPELIPKITEEYKKHLGKMSGGTAGQ